jgi:hypothetical protein
MRKEREKNSPSPDSPDVDIKKTMLDMPPFYPTDFTQLLLYLNYRQ